MDVVVVDVLFEFVLFVCSLWTDSDDDDATDFEQRTTIRPILVYRPWVEFYVERVVVVPALQWLLMKHFHYANYYFPIRQFVPLMRLYANDLAYLVYRAMIVGVVVVATLHSVAQVNPLDELDFV